MTIKAVQELKIGDRVRYTDGTEGAVEQANWCAVVIRWDDGDVGTFWHDQAADVLEPA